MKNWEIFLGVLGGVTTIIVFSRLIYLKVIKPLWGWFKKWETMYKEFVPDSGKSMKDQVTNMEVTIGSIKSVQDAQIRLDNLPIITCNSGGRCIRVNKSWQNLSGMSEAEAVGWGWLNAVETQDRQRVHDEWVSALETNSEINSHYKMINKETKVVFNAEAICVINRNSKNEVVSIVGTVIKLQDDTPIKGEKSTPA